MKRSRARIVVGLAAVALAAALLSTATISQAEQPGTSKMHVMRINNGQGPDSNNGQGNGADNGQAKGARPRPGGTNNLIYGGGAVTVDPKVYIVYWGSEWANGFGSGATSSDAAQTYVEGFFTNVGGSSWNNSVTQYCQYGTVGATSCAGGTPIHNNAGQFGSSTVDTSSVPAKPTQGQIAAVALNAATNVFHDTSPNAIVMVFTPSGKSMSGFGTQWCAWHSSTTTATGRLGYAYIPYMPDAGSSCGKNSVNANGYFDGFSIVAGHEYAEAETDIFPSSAWVDSRGAENADKCAWTSLSNQPMANGTLYPVQPLWSNASSSCVMSY